MLRLALVPARSVSFCLENVTIRHSNSPAKTPTRHATHAEKALFLVVVKMWPSRGGGGGGNTNAPYSPFEDDSNEKSYAAKLYTKKKKKNYTNNGLLFNGYNNNTNTNNNNNRKGVKIIGGVLLLMTILRVFWSSRLSATNTTNRTSGFRHVDKYDREGNAKSMMDGGNGVVVDGNNEYYDVNNDSDDLDGKKTKKTKKNLWSRATNDAPRSSRVSSQKVAANLVIDHLGRALAPMISKYVDIDVVAFECDEYYE